MLTTCVAAVATAGAVVAAGRPPPRGRLRELAAVRGSPPARSGAGLMSAGAATAVGLAVTSGPAAAVAGVGGLLVARRVVMARRRRQREQAAAAAVVEVAFALAAELRAGRPPAAALAAVADVGGPLQPALRAAQAAAELGMDPYDDLRAAAGEPGARRLAALAAAWAVAGHSGARVAGTLERIGEAIDRDAELQAELEAAMAGPRATMLVLGVLPVLGIGLGQAVGAHPLTLLLHRPLGWALLAAAAALDAVGAAVTFAIARRALGS